MYSNVETVRKYNIDTEKLDFNSASGDCPTQSTNIIIIIIICQRLI